MSTAEDHLRQEAQNRVPGFFLPAAAHRKVAIYQALGKMHKVPPKLCFLVASHATVLQSHGMWLAALFLDELDEAIGGPLVVSAVESWRIKLQDEMDM